ncbi:MAG: exodeoxyribonuclease VII large subunit [Lachnospiraceae bacterium]
MTNERMTLSVAQLNEYVRRTLASDVMLKNICITGEISNFKRHVSGHWYFTLKDEEAATNQRNRASVRRLETVRFQPENGMSVRLTRAV